MYAISIRDQRQTVLISVKYISVFPSSRISHVVFSKGSCISFFVLCRWWVMWTSLSFIVRLCYYLDPIKRYRLQQHHISLDEKINIGITNGNPYLILTYGLRFNFCAARKHKDSFISMFTVHFFLADGRQPAVPHHSSADWPDPNCDLH